MNLAEPASALATGLTMPLLEALAARSTPASAAQLRRVAGQGTEAGVRRGLDRLSADGIVSRELVADRAVYTLNVDHVLYPAVAAMLSARDELARRLRTELGNWAIPPVAGAMYGSAARRDGGTDSDIDLFVIRPKLAAARDRDHWDEQIQRLRELVERWTGNPCQITDRSLPDLRRLVTAREPIVESWRRDAVPLAGQPITEILAAG